MAFRTEAHRRRRMELRRAKSTLDRLAAESANQESEKALREAAGRVNGTLARELGKTDTVKPDGAS